MVKYLSFLAAAGLLACTTVQAATPGSTAGIRTTTQPGRAYPWKKDIVTTIFWVGEGGTTISPTTQKHSAWVRGWPEAYGGYDSPEARVGLGPKNFAPTLNVFYVALPFNDVAFPDLARKWCPWWKEPGKGERYISQCKGKWVEIRAKNGKSCFATWEDVGPLTYDNAAYVFGNGRPTSFHSGAGLDVSPAVRDFLGINGGSFVTDWRFVEYPPDGPWIDYGEKAIVFTALKSREATQRKNKPPTPGNNAPLVPATLEADGATRRKTGTGDKS